MTTEADIREVSAGDDWSAWGGQFGWSLYAWTWKDRATFYHERTGPSVPFTITGQMRRDIDAALSRAHGDETT